MLGKNFMGLYLQLPAGHIRFAVDLLKDLLENPSFDAQEIQDQKEQMKAGITAQKDNIYTLAAKELRELLFEKHPFRLDEAGTIESVNRIMREDVVNFYRKFFSPDHMVLTVFGGFSTPETIDALTQILSNLKVKEISLSSSQELPPAATREKFLDIKKEQAIAMIGFPGVDLFNRDYYAMEVLTAILGSPFSGRIFSEVRDKMGQAYNLGGNFLASRDAGMLSFHVLTSPENVDQVKQILLHVIENLRNTDVGDDELKSIKSYLKGKFQRGIETNAALSSVSAIDELLGLGYDRYLHYAQRIDEVTAADIKRLAALYLDIQKAAVVISRPKN